MAWKDEAGDSSEEDRQMTLEEAHEFYKNPDNLAVTGPGQRPSWHKKKIRQEPE